MPKQPDKFKIELELAEMVTIEQLLSKKIYDLSQKRYPVEQQQSIKRRINYYANLLERIKNDREKIIKKEERKLEREKKKKKN